MKRILLQEPGNFAIADVPVNKEVTAGHAIVKVHCVGICGTDLHAYQGRQPFFTYPRVLGHELGVEVMQVSPNSFGIEAGDKCSVEPYLNCSSCIACKRGKTNCCTQMQVLGVHIDGGMQEFMQVPVHKLHRSGSLRFHQLALVETLAIGDHALERAQATADDTILIIGAGPIGLAVIQFAKLITNNIIVLDRDAARLQFCREKMNIPFALLPDTHSIINIKGLFAGELPTLVFDATGNQESMVNAFQYVAHGGRLVYVGLFQGDVTFNDPEFHKRELTLLASRNATGNAFTKIIKLMESEKIDAAPWITHRARLQEVPTTFSQWLDPQNKVIKAMVEVS